MLASTGVQALANEAQRSGPLSPELCTAAHKAAVPLVVFCWLRRLEPAALADSMRCDTALL